MYNCTVFVNYKGVKGINKQLSFIFNVYSWSLSMRVWIRKSPYLTINTQKKSTLRENLHNLREISEIKNFSTLTKTMKLVKKIIFLAKEFFSGIKFILFGVL